MPAKAQNTGPVYLDEHHQRISEFGADYFDDDDERDAFVTELMSRRGYRSTTRTEWAAPEVPESNGVQKPAGPQKPSYFKK